MRTRTPTMFTLATALALGAAGCGTRELRPEEKVERPERPAPPPAPTARADVPTPVVAPVDRWRAALREAVPAGYTVSDAIDQLDAPTTWTRRAGDRGLRFEIFDAKGATRLTITLMPDGFEGRSEDLGLEVRGGAPAATKAKARPSGTALPEAPYGPTAEGFFLFLGNGTGEAWRTAQDDVARAFKARRVNG